MFALLIGFFGADVILLIIGFLLTVAGIVYIGRIMFYILVLFLILESVYLITELNISIKRKIKKKKEMQIQHELIRKEIQRVNAVNTQRALEHPEGYEIERIKL